LHLVDLTMNPSKAITDWEQFSLEVDLDQVDELEALLGEVLPGSLVVEKNYGDLFPAEVAGYQGPAIIRGYYPAADNSQVRPRIMAVLIRANCSAQPVFSPLKSENWATAWQARYHPIPVGERLIVVPSWLKNPFPERLAINLDPGMAFGSGTHPTTQLSLELLELCISRFQPEKMIDVGCGSGILSIAGAKLGLRQVLGVDIDPDAVDVSRRNAHTNRVQDATIFQVGSVAEVLGLGEDLQPSPLVAANIIAPILAVLFQDGLGNLVSPRGCLVLSGILEEQAPDILEDLRKSGFELWERRQREEWVGLVGVKRPAG
jgi:ribosomal protein L11 methyltransferase